MGKLGKRKRAKTPKKVARPKNRSKQKPKSKKTSQHRGLFDSFTNVKSVRQGESLRFRDKNGRLVKFDGRKKLIAEIWLGNKKTNRVLNKTKKGQPVPEKFHARTMRKRLLFLEHAKKGPRQASEPKIIRTKFDSRFSIADNIEAKCEEMLTDIVTYSKRGTGSYLTIEVTLPTEDGNKYEVMNPVIKSQNKSEAAMDLARLIIYRLYRNELRGSSLKDTSTGKRFKYVRSYPIKFTWDETKRLRDM